MMQPEIVVYLTPPGFDPIDITSRVEDVRTISSTIEEDLAQLVHGDVDLDLDNHDGWFEELLRFADVDDNWEVEVVRETGRRRPKWDIVFGGIVDVSNVVYDRKDLTMQAHVFTFSRLLEKTTAEDIKRTFGARTGSVSAGSPTVTASDASDIIAGDTCRLTSDTVSEEFVVASVSGSTITATENVTNAFSSDVLEVVTPFYRLKSLAFLIGEVFTAAGIDNYAIELDAEPTGNPFATAVNTQGLTAGTTIDGLLSQGGEIEVVHSGGTDTAANPQDGFTNESATTTPKGDWQPYEDTEPGSLVDADAGGDNGTRAFDHVTGDYYTLVLETPSPPPDEQLWIYKNGAQDTSLAQANSPAAIIDWFHDWDDTNGAVWATWVRTDGVGGTLYSVRKGSMGTDGTWGGGGVRNINALGIVAVQHSFVGNPSAANDVRFYEASTANVLHELTNQPRMKMWSMRACDGRISVLYNDGSTTRLRQWDDATYEQVADFKIADEAVQYPMMTVWTSPTAGDVLVIAINRSMYVVSRQFLGVLEYADFDDMSCADAIRELALVAIGTAAVDQYKNGRIRGRGAYTTEHATAIGPPLSRESRQLWEDYRTSVAVTGETAAGGDIEQVVGDTGNTEHRLELESKLIQSDSLANGIAQGHLGYYNVKRSEEMVEIPEGDRILEPFDVVELDGKLYLVTKPETDLVDREQKLVLVSV